MAGLACMFMPFGTVLGVFTIIVLVKENVKGMFRGAASKDGTDGAPAAQEHQPVE
jgi:hypothetical protein